MTPRDEPWQGERLAFNAGIRREIAPVAPAAPVAVIDDVQSPASSAGAHRSMPKETKDWAFTWTLVFTTVLFLRPQDVFEPLGALHLAELSALIGLASLFTARLSRGQSLTRMTPEFIGVLTLGAVILLTAPFSIWFGGAVSTFTELYLKVTLVYLLAVNVLSSPRRIERLTWVLVLALGYIGLRAVFDYVRGVNLIAGGTRVQGSVGGLIQNPNDLALHMVVFLPLAIFMAMRPVSMFKRLVAASAGVFMMGAIVASGSRGGFLGFIAMVVVLAVFAARQRPALVFAGALAVMCALPILPAQYWRRISSITDSSKDDYQSSTARRQLFGEAYDAFLEHPLTGVGAGQFKDYAPEKRIEAWHETHNIWLQVAAELGVFGVLVFAYLIVRAFSGVWQTRRLLARVHAAAAAARRPAATRTGPVAAPIISEYDTSMLDAHSAAMAASLVGFFVCSFFSSVAYNWTFYYLMALAVTPRDILRAAIPSGRRARSIGAAA